MSHSDLNLVMLLRLNNQMSRGLREAMTSAQRDMLGVERGTTSATRSMTGLNRAARESASSLTRIATASRGINAAPVDRLTRSLRGLHTAASSSYSMLMNVAKVGASIAAGGFVLKAAAEKPMAYDRRLALLSNTANSDLDVGGRIAAKKQLDSGIRNAVNTGGGTVDKAMDALNALVGSGAFGNATQSLKLLPMLQKFSTGSGAQAEDLAAIMVAAKRNMGITDKEMPVMLSKAIRAGQLGGFELTDMAKFLPEQMAAASANGMKGMGSFEALLSANQVSRITAGNSSEAGNNLQNLLLKINSADTQKDFDKQGIDLSGSLVESRGKGVLTLDSFVGLVDKIVSEDKGYTALRDKADHETGDDKKATLEAMADILQQKSIGKVVQDRQAMMALLAMMLLRDTYRKIKGAVGEEAGAEGENSFKTVADTLDYKSEQLGNKKAFAAIDALGAIEGPLGKLMDKTNELAQDNSNLAAATYGATVALTSLAAAAGAGGLLSLLTGGAGGSLRAGAAAVGATVMGSPLLALGAAELGGNLVGHMLSSQMSAETLDTIGGVVAQALANFGNKEAKKAIEINLHLDGKQIARVVTDEQSKAARRN